MGDIAAGEWLWYHTISHLARIFRHQHKAAESKCKWITKAKSSGTQKKTSRTTAIIWKFMNLFQKSSENQSKSTKMPKCTRHRYHAQSKPCTLRRGIYTCASFRFVHHKMKRNGFSNVVESEVGRLSTQREATSIKWNRIKKKKKCCCDYCFDTSFAWITYKKHTGIFYQYKFY